MNWDAVREGVIGSELCFGGHSILYADWTASGRLYGPIEDYMRYQIAPWVANTHTESSDTGRAMSHLYEEARQVIRAHVNAAQNDVLILTGAGMTGAVNKLQRMMGLGRYDREEDKPLVIITHMEHHSNHTSWLTRPVDLVMIQPDESGLPCLSHLGQLLEEHRHRKHLIASVTACSNVTGIETPYRDIARQVHAAGGYILVDFAASAPYVDIDMHPDDPGTHLDAVMFSPHKFLGGPGSCGVLVFNPALYQIDQPDQPGGGTVRWTNPWGGHQFYDSIELREDGGTPGFLQAIRAALAIRLKEQLGVSAIKARESELTQRFMAGLARLPQVRLLGPESAPRLPVFSFYIPGVHHELVVRLLNDKFGIQCRGGCSCAGTYGHLLLGVSQQTSQAITDEIDRGDLSRKPGWVRISLHPTTSDAEVDRILQALTILTAQIDEWRAAYRFDAATGQWRSTHNLQRQSPTLSGFMPIG